MPGQTRRAKSTTSDCARHVQVLAYAKIFCPIPRMFVINSGRWLEMRNSRCDEALRWSDKGRCSQPMRIASDAPDSEADLSTFVGFGRGNHKSAVNLCSFCTLPHSVRRTAISLLLMCSMPSSHWMCRVLRLSQQINGCFPVAAVQHPV